MSSQYFAVLDCGHYFVETRPDDITDPRNGELRVCGHPDHYPQRFRARYYDRDEAEKIRKLITDAIFEGAPYGR